LNRLVICKRIHGSQCDVEAGVGVVDGEHIDAPSLVVESPAGTTIGRVPSYDGLRTADIWEGGNVALRLPVLAGDEAVWSIGAGDCGERACVVVIATIVGD
jgi:hypothetical protein